MPNKKCGMKGAKMWDVKLAICEKFFLATQGKVCQGAKTTGTWRMEGQSHMVRCGARSYGEEGAPGG